MSTISVVVGVVLLVSGLVGHALFFERWSRKIDHRAETEPFRSRPSFAGMFNPIPSITWSSDFPLNVAIALSWAAITAGILLLAVRIFG